MFLRRNFVLTLAASIALAASAGAGVAAEWPSKPIKVVVPAGAGGDTDFNARTMAKYFEKITGKTMIVSNMNGGGGTIAMSEVRGAAPDGNTILFGHTGQLIVNEVSGLIDYDFEAFDVCCIAGVDKSVVFVTSKKSGIKSVQDLVARSKAQPGSVVYGTELGGFSHLQGLIFERRAGVKMKIVDTGSASDKITSLLGGRTDLSAISYGPVKDYGSTGDMNIVGQFSNERNPLLGNVKTLKEQGVDVSMEKPYVIAFPKGTDPAIVKKMAEVMKKITEDPGYAKALEDGFKQPVSYYGTADAIKHLREVRADFMQYKDLLRQKK